MRGKASEDSLKAMKADLETERKVSKAFCSLWCTFTASLFIKEHKRDMKKLQEERDENRKAATKQVCTDVLISHSADSAVC